MVIMKMTQSSTNDMPQDRLIELDVKPDAIAVTLSCEANAPGAIDERFLEFVVRGRSPKEEFRITFDRQELSLLTDLVERLKKHYAEEQILEKGTQ